MNEKIIKEIDETIDFNRLVRCHSLSSSYDEASRRSNKILAKAKQVIIKATDNYEKGLDDAWALAQKIGGCCCDDNYYDADELYDIFGYSDTVDVFDHFSYNEALEKIEAYEKKKEREARMPKIGDVVEVHYIFNDVIERGVLLSLGNAGFNYLNASGKIIYANYSDNIELDNTGEHVDILGALGK